VERSVDDDETISVIVGGWKSGYAQPLSIVSFDSLGQKQLTSLMPTIMAEFRVSRTQHKKFADTYVIF